MTEPLIIGAGEADYSVRPPTAKTTERFVREAVQRALADAGLEPRDVDGFGFSSFTSAPDAAIDVAWKLGLRVRWLAQDTTGGCCGINLLRHATRAVEAGDAENVLLVAGDRVLNREFIRLTDGYNKATRDHLATLPNDGPNTLFSFVTQRHMERHSLAREDYGQVSVAQRRWATKNPGAVYRTPLSLEEYLAAPAVAPPLGRYDCPRALSGADAIVLSARPPRGRPASRVRAIAALMNPDDQAGDGLTTGLAEVADDLWREARARPEDVDVTAIYDDYPVMVLIQATDIGLAPGGQPGALVERIAAGMPLNTSGGMLSAGQAGAAGGFHGLVEVVRQLHGQAGDRQVGDAALGLVTGYGMVLYRHGACANAAVLERAR